MQKYEVKDHVPSFLPEGRQWKLVWHDEFDGPELDRSKWGFRLNFWGRPFDAYTDQGIRFDGKSNLEIHRVERNGCYASAQLQTGANSFDNPPEEESWKYKRTWRWPLGTIEKPTFMHRFGYYECRCKFQEHPEEMWSAFWTQSPSIGAAYDPEWCGVESDIMECFKTGTATTGNIMNGYGSRVLSSGRVRYDLKETPDGYHVFAMDWTPSKYVFYCDGEIVSEDTLHVSQVPQFILLTTEVQGYRKGEPLKLNGEFRDDAFIVDYVRVFDDAEISC